MWYIMIINYENHNLDVFSMFLYDYGISIARIFIRYIVKITYILLCCTFLNI